MQSVASQLLIYQYYLCVSWCNGATKVDKCTCVLLLQWVCTLSLLSCKRYIFSVHSLLSMDIRYPQSFFHCRLFSSKSLDTGYSYSYSYLLLGQHIYIAITQIAITYACLCFSINFASSQVPQQLDSYVLDLLQCSYIATETADQPTHACMYSQLIHDILLHDYLCSYY